MGYFEAQLQKTDPKIFPTRTNKRCQHFEICKHTQLLSMWKMTTMYEGNKE
jgi:hypothetical protein